MADLTVARSDRAAHGTLVADVVDTVTFQRDWKEVEVLSHDGAGAIYFTVDGFEPSVGGANCYVIPAATGAAIVKVEGGGNTVVKLISDGAPTYSVTGIAA